MVIRAASKMLGAFAILMGFVFMAFNDLGKPSWFGASLTLIAGGCWLISRRPPEPPDPFDFEWRNYRPPA